jgi:hypothetical protein
MNNKRRETLKGRGVIVASMVLKCVIDKQGVALELCASRYGPLADCCEDGKEPFRFVQCKAWRGHFLSDLAPASFGSRTLLPGAGM